MFPSHSCSTTMSLWRAKFGSSISSTWASSAGQWQEAELFSSSDFICDASGPIVCLVYEMGQMQSDHWLSHALRKLLSGWLRVGRSFLKAAHQMDRQNRCYGCWYLSFSPKRGRKNTHSIWEAEILCGKKTFCHFFFPLGLIKMCHLLLALHWPALPGCHGAAPPSLLSSATCGPRLSDLDFPQTGMSALQPRPEAAEARVDQESWFWGPRHQLFRLLDTLSTMLLFDLFGPH